VEIVGPRDVPSWIRAASQGFANSDEVSQEEQETGSIVAAARDTTLLLVRCGDEVGGTAALSCRSSISVFFADSTRPRFRGEGIQSELIAARIRHAAAFGCRIATASTLDGSCSERNYIRMGFKRLYKRIVLQYRP
jgi:GNAT superfamily N-acetyltransferase